MASKRRIRKAKKHDPQAKRWQAAPGAEVVASMFPKVSIQALKRRHKNKKSAAWHLKFGERYRRAEEMIKNAPWGEIEKMLSRQGKKQ